MSKKSTRWGWYLGLGMMIASAYAAWAKCAIAQIPPNQITPDGTLGDNSTININGNIFEITGGTRAGNNLFHSFRDFSVVNGSEAHFNNAVDINNIISRVTGSSVSNIDGLIKVLGNANLFLLNPNGIIFGQNARLDIRGSFVASTANSIKFADGFEFSAKNTQSTPLLTISVPLGLQFGANPQRIQVRGSGHNFTYSNDATVRMDSPGLQVLPGKTLALVGGDLELEGGNLRVESGRIELGSVASPSLVNLTQTDSGFALGYAGVQNFGDIKLSQKASLDTSGEGGGSIQVQGRRLSLRDGSSILSITSGSKAGGSFTVNATESVELIGQSTDGKYASSLSSEVQGAGSSGEMRITTGKLIATDGAFAQNFNYSSGQAGNLTVQASDIDLAGSGLYSSGLYIGTGSTGNSGNLTISAEKLSVRDGATVFADTYDKGNGGNLTIDTRELLVRNGAFVSASTRGAGKGGDLTVNASEKVEVTGIAGLYTQAGSGKTGAAGNLTINTPVLLVGDGAVVSTSTAGAGKGGNLTVNAIDKVEVIGTYPADSRFRSGLFTQQNTEGATGNAGDLTINTPVLLVRDGATVSSSTFGAGKGGNLTVNATEKVEVIGTIPNGQSGSRLTAGTSDVGNAGNLTINTRRLVVKDSQVSTSTDGKGSAGIFTVNASDSIELSGIFFGANDDYPAGLFAQNNGGEGRGGTLNIQTGRLSISNGAKVQVATFGSGDAGDLFIRASDIDIFETPRDRYTYFAGGIFAGVQTSRDAQEPTRGNGGSATIETNRLTVRDGGVVTTSTQGQGNAGILQIRATDFIEVFGTAPGAEFRASNEPSNSEISAAATPLSTGNAGSLSIETGKLIVRDRGTVTVKSQGTTQAAGNLEINARSINLDNGSITATTNSGNGGDMFLSVKDLLLLRNQSTISATAGTAQQGGDGGNITIDAPSGFIVAVPNENSDITADAFSGQGGNVRIRAANIFNIAPLSRQELERLRPDDLNPRQLQTNDITAISQQNPTLSGQISINTPDADPNRELVELPIVLLDTSNQVDTSCAAFGNGEGNQFTITGRGGLPPSPNEPLAIDVVWSDTRLPSTTAWQDREQTPSAKPASKPEAVAIVPATGWVFNGKGQVTLISHASTAASLGSSTASCPQE